MSGAEQLDASALGRRLRDARQAAGLTQLAVAERLGMARTTVVAIEAGERRVTPHEMIQLAECFGRSVSGLVGRHEPAPEPLLRAPLHRAAEGEPPLAAAISELEDFANDYAALERFAGATPAASLPPEYPAGGPPAALAADAAASAERNRLGLGDGPIGGLRRRLAADAGAKIFFYSMPSALAGLFFYTDALGACVGINANHPLDRQNWTLAHEYAHLLFSRRRPELTLLRAGQARRTEERLAEAFARSFLMPAAGLNRRVAEIESGLGRGLAIADVLGLAQAYQVSTQAMVLRLEDLRRIPPGSWDRLASAGFRVREAQRAVGIASQSPSPPALPDRYVRLAVAAYDDAKISEGQLARYLRTDRVGARQRVAEILDALRTEDTEGRFLPLRLPLSRPIAGD